MIVNKRIRWNENISPDLKVAGDKSLIQKVINNLVSNAVSYSPEESQHYYHCFSEKRECSV